MMVGDVDFLPCNGCLSDAYISLKDFSSSRFVISFRISSFPDRFSLGNGLSNDFAVIEWLAVARAVTSVFAVTVTETFAVTASPITQGGRRSLFNFFFLGQKMIKKSYHHNVRKCI